VTTKKEVLSALRAKCLDCAGGSKREVSKCGAYTCRLHPFRFGRDPHPNQTTGFAKLRAQTSNREPRED
jgi:hypothetical protein